MQEGYYDGFSVENRLNEDENWEVCKGPYNVTEPLRPHVVHCKDPATLAKFIRLSTSGNLLLREVIVIAEILGE